MTSVPKEVYTSKNGNFERRFSLHYFSQLSACIISTRVRRWHQFFVYKELSETYNEPSKTTVYHFYSEFNRGRFSVADEFREGRQKSVYVPENINGNENTIRLRHLWELV